MSEEVKAERVPTTRGFAGMDPEKRREIRSMGGKAAHARGTAHRFTSEEARVAGRAGGLKQSREHMSRIGRIGGASNAARRRAKGTAAE